MIEINATLIAQIINFLILVVILTYVGYKPVVKMLAERRTMIENNIRAAEQGRQEAERMRQEYQNQLAEARTEAQTIVEKALKVGEQTKDQIVREAREEHAKLLKSAQSDIERERLRALAELRGEVVSLSILAAGKIIGQKLDEQANAKMVEDFIGKLDDQKIGGLKC